MVTVEEQMSKIEEREALIELFEAMNGKHWVKKDGWCSDISVAEWHGVTINEEGYVITLGLTGAYPEGRIPEALGKLVNLTYIDLSNDGCNIMFDGLVSGPIPETYKNLTKLQHLDLRNNKMSGPVPNALGYLPNLTYLDTRNNNFSELIPNSLERVEDLRIDSWNRNLIASSTEIWSFLDVVMTGASVGLGYFDLGPDVYSAYIFYGNEQYNYFGLQLFFYFPTVLLAVYDQGDIWDRMYTLTQTRLLVEAYRTLDGEKATRQFTTMKVYEAVVEACPICDASTGGCITKWRSSFLF